MAAHRKWNSIVLLFCLVLLLLSFIVTVDATPSKKPKKDKKSSTSDDATTEVDEDPVVQRDTSNTANSMAESPWNPQVQTVTPTTAAYAASSFQSFDSLQDSEVVLTMEIEKQSNTWDIDVKKKQFVDLHRCVCRNDTSKCEAIVYGENIDHIQHTGSSMAIQNVYYYTRNYWCIKLNSTMISCERMTTSSLTSRCGSDTLLNCGHMFTMFGADCEQGIVNVLWGSSESVTLSDIHPTLYSMFSCVGSCEYDDDDDYSSTTTTTTTTTTESNALGNNKNNDDGNSIDPAVIGAIVACAVILVILISVFAFWIHRKKQQAKPATNSSSRGMTSSFDGVEHGRVGGFQKKRSQVDLTAQGGNNSPGRSTQANGRSSGYSNMPNAANGKPSNGRIGRENFNNTSTRSNNEPMYASLDEMSIAGRNEYSVLEDANKYQHPYHALGKPIQDPRLRPPMPLPTQATNQPLPYYSLAQPTGDEPANQNNDVVSGQYIDIIGDDGSPAPANDNGPSRIPATAPPITEAGSSRPPTDTPHSTYSELNNNGGASPYRKKNMYFQLERQSSANESVGYEQFGNRNSEARSMDSTAQSSGYEIAGQFGASDSSGYETAGQFGVSGNSGD